MMNTTATVHALNQQLNDLGLQNIFFFKEIKEPPVITDELKPLTVYHYTTVYGNNHQKFLNQINHTHVFNWNEKKQFSTDFSAKELPTPLRTIMMKEIGNTNSGNGSITHQPAPATQTITLMKSLLKECEQNFINKGYIPTSEQTATLLAFDFDTTKYSYHKTNRDIFIDYIAAGFTYSDTIQYLMFESIKTGIPVLKPEQAKTINLNDYAEEWINDIVSIIVGEPVTKMRIKPSFSEMWE